jgi:CBS domain-containing membrane protein
MKVSEVMQRHATEVCHDDSLQHAQQLMRWSDCRHLPVVDRVSRMLVGVISERDILHALARHPGSARTLLQPVSEFMSDPVESVGPDVEVAEAAIRMATREVGCLPVVERGLVAGLLTTSDVLGALAQSPIPPRSEVPTSEPTVAAVMYTEPIAVPPHALLTGTAGRMAQRGVRHACVVDGFGHVIGIVSDRDIRRVIGHPQRALAPSYIPANLHSLRVEQIMSVPRTVREDAPIHQALSLLVTNHVGAIPVTDSHGKLCGIVSYVDLLHYLGELLPIAS